MIAKRSVSLKCDLNKKRVCFLFSDWAQCRQICCIVNCKECNAKHHTLLHGPKPVATLHEVSNKQRAMVSNPANTTNQSAFSAGELADRSALTGYCVSGASYADALLPTSLVPIHNKAGEKVHLRGRSDSCSKVSFITEP